jgi:hypothetical protein
MDKNFHQSVTEISLFRRMAVACVCFVYMRDVAKYAMMFVWSRTRSMLTFFFVNNLTDAWNPRHGGTEAEY